LKYLGHNPEIVADVTHYKIRLCGDFHSGVIENSILLGYDCCVTGQSVLDVQRSRVPSSSRTWDLRNVRNCLTCDAASPEGWSSC